MTVIATRVLIIHRQMAFAVSLKRGLEQVGPYQVVAFQSSTAVLEYLQLHPQDVVLVDVTLSDLPAADLIVRLRAIQPDMGIIVCPQTPQAESLVVQLDLQGVFNERGGIRQLLPLIERAIANTHDTLSDTAQAEPISADVDTSYIQRDNERQPGPRALPEFDLADDHQQSDDGDSETSAQQMGASQSMEIVLEDDTPTNMVRAQELFERLAAEEPPMPLLEDSGTVSDLMFSVSEKNLDEVVAALSNFESGNHPDEPLYFDEDDDDSDSPAKLVLINALDETVPFDVEALVKSIEQQMPPTNQIRPLPSWVEEGELFIHEPDFLPDDLSGLETGEYAGDVTAPSSLQHIESNPQDLETDVLEPRTRSRPLRPDDLPPVLPEIMADVDENDVVENEDTLRVDLPPAPLLEPEPPPDSIPEVKPFAALSREQAQLPAPTAQSDDEREDSYIAQLALHLTQVSLELAAESTILARDGVIVAHAGNLAYEELEDIRDAVADDWNASANQARIRFIALPASGRDYMLYSRQTDIGFTLTMIFVGNLPLHVIRRQSNRLIEALQTVPDAIAPVYDTEQIAAVAIEEEAPQPEAAGPLTPYAYVWLLHDENALLDSELGAILSTLLANRLRQQAWQIQLLDVRETYIYLVANVPGESPPNEVVRDLMQQSAKIVFDLTKAIDPDALWSDSYLIVKPGRELTDEEIQQFVNFVRD